MNDFEEFEEVLKRHHSALLDFLNQAEAEASLAGHDKMIHFIRDQKSEVTQGLLTLAEKSKNFYPALQKALGKRTVRLEKQIEVLNKTKDTLMSDNILLEYKKKDLLILTQKLEEAYEEISEKNKELIQQQQKIYDQAEKLNAVNQQVLEKNKELELQKEALLDQSDYLHEANEAITVMNEQLQTQKDEILHKNEELLNLNNEKNNLIGIVAHDLKSPLNQMKGLLTLIKMTSKLDEETQQYIGMLESSTNRLTDMIGKILDVEAIDSKKVNITLERINLTEILSNLVQRFEVTAQQKSIELISSIQEDVIIEADRMYSEQAYENLISNAIKFSPANRKVFVNLTTENGKAKGEVKDQGPGISDEDKKKLFGKYQKLTAKPTGNEISTGLGLSIVKKFVDAMGGDIWCESEAGKGASFFIRLPLAK
ncbi:MAG TPA: ATP-binding protein [Chryseosolibacter sp.]|nr:ATP-binding protein [Chryseosolibacter sp.]